MHFGHRVAYLAWSLFCAELILMNLMQQLRGVAAFI